MAAPGKAPAETGTEEEGIPVVRLVLERGLQEQTRDQLFNLFCSTDKRLDEQIRFVERIESTLALDLRHLHGIDTAVNGRTDFAFYCNATKQFTLSLYLHPKWLTRQ